MVYCTKCGTKNPDDAETCSNCGASLHPVRAERERYYRRRYESECFGLPHGGTVVGIVIGLLILLAGLIVILQQTNLIPTNVDIWPFVLIFFGIIILAGALYRMSRRY
jgi:uncharacterized membrane protein YvbJ